MTSPDNNTRQRIKKAFKSMSLTMPFEQITISTLCQNSGISRKSFYTHFRSKNDLIEWIFYDDAVSPIVALEPLLATSKTEVSSLLLGEKLYQSIKDNEEFYLQFTELNREHILVQMITKNLIKLHEELFKTREMMTLEYEYSSYFIAYAQAGCIVRWLRKGLVVPPHDLAHLFCGWVQLSGMSLTGRAPLS